MGSKLSLSEQKEETKPRVDSRRKFVRYRDQGSTDNVNNEKIRILAGHILKIICCIEQKKWNEANDALNAKKVAQSCGFRIDTPMKVFDNIDDAITFARGRAMWYKSFKKIRLPQVAIGKKGTSEDEWKFPSEIPELATRIYPIWLEEWIHAFQYLIASPVCDQTIEFQKSPQFNKTWNINEVDVFAIYRDLGWCESMLNEMESRYDERIAFAKFSQKEHSKNQVVILCCKIN